jgi:Tfp pilus assembly protein FimT
MVKNRLGITLVELVFTVVIAGILLGAISVGANFVYTIYEKAENEAVNSIANISSGTEFIVQRILRSKSHTITDGGKAVEFETIYAGSKRNAKIYFNDNMLYYKYDINDENPARVFLRDIDDVKFIVADIGSEKRLALEITGGGQDHSIVVRTAVTGRNRPIPSARIN